MTNASVLTEEKLHLVKVFLWFQSPIWNVKLERNLVVVCNRFLGENRTSPVFYHATGRSQEKKTRQYQTTNTFLLVIDKTNIFLFWEGGILRKNFLVISNTYKFSWEGFLNFISLLENAKKLVILERLWFHVKNINGKQSAR